MTDPRVEMQAALKKAMIEKESLRRDVLRLTMSAFKQVEVDERKELTAEDAMNILQREVKKRRESIDEARKAGRQDIVDQEELELTYLIVFLPTQLTRDEIVGLVREAITESGATSAKEMGKVMGLLSPKVKGKADGKLVNEIVREQLTNA